MSDGGKGSKPRPFSVSHDEWSKRWDAIFQRDLDDKEEVKLEQQKQKETAIEEKNG